MPGACCFRQRSRRPRSRCASTRCSRGQGKEAVIHEHPAQCGEVRVELGQRLAHLALCVTSVQGERAHQAAQHDDLLFVRAQRDLPQPAVLVKVSGEHLALVRANVAAGRLAVRVRRPGTRGGRGGHVEAVRPARDGVVAHACQVRAGKIGARQVGPGRVRAAKQRAGQIRSLEARPDQAGAAQIPAGQIRACQICTVEPRAALFELSADALRAYRCLVRVHHRLPLLRPGGGKAARIHFGLEIGEELLDGARA